MPDLITNKEDAMVSETVYDLVGKRRAKTAFEREAETRKRENKERDD